MRWVRSSGWRGWLDLLDEMLGSEDLLLANSLWNCFGFCLPRKKSFIEYACGVFLILIRD